jgi:hypothetical protein
MNDDARRALPLAHLVDGLGPSSSPMILPMLGAGSNRPSATASSVPYQSCGRGPPPNWIVMPLCVAAVKSIVPASYHPPATYTRAMNSHASTISCSSPLRPTHSKITCVVRKSFARNASRHTSYGSRNDGLTSTSPPNVFAYSSRSSL